MAPRAPSTAANNNSDHTQAVFGKLELFLSVYGAAEYASYRSNAAAPHLPYEDWASSEHVLGPFLYHLTLDAWDAVSSSDDETLEEPARLASPDLPERERTVTANGNGMLHITNTPSPTEDVKENEPVTSTKKRQRRKKKFLSAETVASEDSDDNVNSAPAAEIALPSTASPAINGRRTSLVQRHKKSSLSAPKSPSKDLPESPKRSKIVKLSMPEKFMKGNRKSLPMTVVSPDSKDTDSAVEAVTPDAAIVTPEGSTTSTSARRGLRVRTPAQQRPYFHHAKLFEEAGVEPTNEDNTNIIESPPKTAATKLAQVVYPDDDDDEDTTNEVQEEVDEVDEVEEANRHVEPPISSEKKSKPKPKPKGQRSKKFHDDEDPEFHAPAAIKAQPVQPPSDPKPKRKRTKKSLQLSEAYVMDSSDAEEAAATAQAEAEAEEEAEHRVMAAATPSQKTKRERRVKPKKSASLVVSSDEDDDKLEMIALREDTPPSAKAKRERRVKPKKSASLVVSSDEEDEELERLATPPSHKAKRERREKQKKSASIIISSDEESDMILLEPDTPPRVTSKAYNVDSPASSPIDYLRSSAERTPEPTPPHPEPYPPLGSIRSVRKRRGGSNGVGSRS